MATKNKREQPPKSGNKTTPVTPPRRYDPLQLAIAVAGMAVTAMLLWGAGQADGLPYCSDGSGCEIVQRSAWSTFLGMPLAAWGLASYLALGVASVMQAPARRRYCALIATSGFLISVYLTVVSAFLIGAFCAYCLVSLGLMSAALLFSLRPSAAAGTRAMRVAGLIAAVSVALLMHASATGMLGAKAAVDPELRALAEHLEQRGIKFYGASWCPHCQQQKELFGAAAQYLPYVECSPHGPKAPRATECEIREIRNYPTWTVDGRRIERVLPVTTLKTLSGFSTAGADAAESPAVAR